MDRHIEVRGVFTPTSGYAPATVWSSHTGASMFMHVQNYKKKTVMLSFHSTVDEGNNDETDRETRNKSNGRKGKKQDLYAPTPKNKTIMPMYTPKHFLCVM